MDAMRDLYQAIKEFYFKYGNVSVVYIEISRYDLNPEVILDNKELPMEMDLLLFPFDYSLLATIKNLNITRLSTPFLPSWTFFLSPAPKPSTNASLAFIAVEPIVLGLFVFFLVLISAIMSIAIIRNKTSGFWLRLNTFLVKFKSYMWHNTNLLFGEAPRNIPLSIPWRIAFIGWLLGIMFINFQISTCLKSEFSETEYDKVETIDDLMKKVGKIKIGVVEGGVEDELITKKGLTEHKYRRLASILKGDSKMGEKMTVEDLIIGDIFDQVADRKLIFISGMVTLLTAMTYQFSNKGNLYDFREIYYYSSPIDESYCVWIYSSSFAGTPLSKIVDEMCLLNSEGQLGHAIQSRTNLITDMLRWSEPPQLESTKLTLKGMESVAILYTFGNAIAIAFFIIHMIIKLSYYLCKN